MPAKSDPRTSAADSEYTYRRRVGGRALLPAIGAGLGVGIGAGLAAFYLTRILLQRTPLRAEPRGHGNAVSRGDRDL